MKTLREYIKEAGEKGVAIGHFNISNLEGLHGIYNAAKKLNLPIIIGVSEGEEKFVGLEEVAALVRTLRERDNYPIFLNADHHASFESVKACIDAGFDALPSGSKDLDGFKGKGDYAFFWSSTTLFQKEAYGKMAYVLELNSTDVFEAWASINSKDIYYSIRYIKD